jgi:hypothetical protein
MHPWTITRGCDLATSVRNFSILRHSDTLSALLVLENNRQKVNVTLIQNWNVPTVWDSSNVRVACRVLFGYIATLFLVQEKKCIVPVASNASTQRDYIANLVRSSESGTGEPPIALTLLLHPTLHALSWQQCILDVWPHRVSHPYKNIFNRKPHCKSIVREFDFCCIAMSSGARCINIKIFQEITMHCTSLQWEETYTLPLSERLHCVQRSIDLVKMKGTGTDDTHVSQTTRPMLPRSFLHPTVHFSETPFQRWHCRESRMPMRTDGPRLGERCCATVRVFRTLCQFFNRIHRFVTHDFKRFHKHILWRCLDISQTLWSSHSISFCIPQQFSSRQVSLPTNYVFFRCFEIRCHVVQFDLIQAQCSARTTETVHVHSSCSAMLSSRLVRSIPSSIFGISWSTRFLW